MEQLSFYLIKIHLNDRLIMSWIRNQVVCQLTVIEVKWHLKLLMELDRQLILLNLNLQVYKMH